MADQTNLTDEEDELQPAITDADRPFTPATDEDDLVADQEDATDRGDPVFDPTHPITDSGIDAHEMYDEGRYGTARDDTPSTNDIVEDYTPPAPQDSGANIADADQS